MSQALQLIHEVEADFIKLKKEYTLFLNDVVKVEPHEAKIALERKVKRLRNIANLRTEEQFRTNNLISKVQSHFRLWERQLEQKYAGSPHRKPPVKKPRREPQPRKPEQKLVTIRDAASQREQVVELYDEYTRLNLILGARKMIDFTKFQTFIHNQTRKIQKAKQVEDVRYQITVQDQKVVIKSKSVKKK